MGLIRSTAKDTKAKAVFFQIDYYHSVGAYILFQKVEGKMFSPLAYTLGFAIAGALITLEHWFPVLSSSVAET